MIKVDFWSDEKVGHLDYITRLLFIGTWNFADDSGVCRANPMYLKGKIFPYDAISNEKIDEALVRLRELRLIKFIRRNKERYLQVVNFTKHQSINHPSNFRYILSEDSSSTPVGLSEDSTPKVKEKVKEKVKDKEKENTLSEVLTTLEIHEENNSSPKAKESEEDISGLIKIQDAESTTITENEYKNLIKECGKKNADLLLHEIHVQQMKTNQQYPSTYWTAVQWFEKRVRENKMQAPNIVAQKPEEKMEKCNQCHQVFRATLVTYNKGVCLECHKKNLQS